MTSESQGRLPDLVSDSRLTTTRCDDGGPGSVTVHEFHEADESHGERVAKRVERWERGKQIGSGGFGRVFVEVRKVDKRTKYCRAVKEISLKSSPGRRVKSWDYVRELEAIAKFSLSKYDRCFVKSYGWFEANDKLYIAMEYMVHGDLHYYLAAQPTPLGEVDARAITFQLTEGLKFMHKEGFAHRDMKPSNVLVKQKYPEKWWVKIADFGISKRILTLTEGQASFKGTPPFMAPELFNLVPSTGGETNLMLSDMWALGEVAFQMMTKCEVFNTTRFNQDRLRKYVQQPGLFPVQELRCRHISVLAVDFIKSCMQPRPQDRFPSDVAIQHKWIGYLNIDTNSTFDSSLPSSKAPDPIGMVGAYPMSGPQPRGSGSNNNNTPQVINVGGPHVRSMLYPDVGCGSSSSAMPGGFPGGLHPGQQRRDSASNEWSTPSNKWATPPPPLPNRPPQETPTDDDGLVMRAPPDIADVLYQKRSRGRGLPVNSDPNMSVRMHGALPAGATPAAAAAPPPARVVVPPMPTPPLRVSSYVPSYDQGPYSQQQQQQQQQQQPPPPSSGRQSFRARELAAAQAAAAGYARFPVSSPPPPPVQDPVAAPAQPSPAAWRAPVVNHAVQPPPAPPPQTVTEDDQQQQYVPQPNPKRYNVPGQFPPSTVAMSLHHRASKPNLAPAFPSPPPPPQNPSGQFGAGSRQSAYEPLGPDGRPLGPGSRLSVQVPKSPTEQQAPVAKARTMPESKAKAEPPTPQLRKKSSRLDVFDVFKKNIFESHGMDLDAYGPDGVVKIHVRLVRRHITQSRSADGHNRLFKDRIVSIPESAEPAATMRTNPYGTADAATRARLSKNSSAAAAGDMLQRARHTAASSGSSGSSWGGRNGGRSAPPPDTAGIMTQLRTSYFDEVGRVLFVGADGGLMLSLATPNKLSVWETDSGVHVKSADVPGIEPTTAILSGSGRRLLCGLANHRDIAVWDLVEPSSPSSPNNSFTAGDVSPRLVCTLRNEPVRELELAQKGIGARRQALALCPTDDLAVSLHLWHKLEAFSEQMRTFLTFFDMPTRKAMQTVEVPARVHSASRYVSSDELVERDGGETERLERLLPYRRPTTDAPDHCFAVAFTPAGSTVVLTVRDQVFLVAVRSKAVVAVLVGQDHLLISANMVLPPPPAPSIENGDVTTNTNSTTTTTSLAFSPTASQQTVTETWADSSAGFGTSAGGGVTFTSIVQTPTPASQQQQPAADEDAPSSPPPYPPPPAYGGPAVSLLSDDDDDMMLSPLSRRHRMRLPVSAASGSTTNARAAAAVAANNPASPPPPPPVSITAQVAARTNPATGSCMVRVWSTAAYQDPAAERVLTHPTNLLATALSPNGDLLLVVLANDVVVLWDLAPVMALPQRLLGNNQPHQRRQSQSYQHNQQQHQQQPPATAVYAPPLRAIPVFRVSCASPGTANAARGRRQQQHPSSSSGSSSADSSSAAGSVFSASATSLHQPSTSSTTTSFSAHAHAHAHAAAAAATTRHTPRWSPCGRRFVTYHADGCRVWDVPWGYVRLRRAEAAFGRPDVDGWDGGGDNQGGGGGGGGIHRWPWSRNAMAAMTLERYDRNVRRFCSAAAAHWESVGFAVDVKDGPARGPPPGRLAQPGAAVVVPGEPGSLPTRWE